MIWLLDLGNSRLKLAPWRPGAGLGAVQAFAHGGADFAPSVQRWAEGLAAADTCWLASVAAPALTAAVADAAASRGSIARQARSLPACAGVRIAYAEPSHLGVDRFLALLAARARGADAWLLVSAGSALTVDLLDPDGQHLGGLIAPGAGHMREALAARFPALSVAGGEVVEFASGTADAVASGSLAAVAGLVERCYRQATQRLGAPPRLLISGGGGEALAAALPFASEPAPSLVLEGLAVYAAQAGSSAP